MESRFYQLCKAKGYSGMIEANARLLSRDGFGIRFTLRVGHVGVQMEVPDEQLVQGDKKVYEYILRELEGLLQKELSTNKGDPDTLCSTCELRYLDCHCDCAREYRKVGG